MSYFKTIYGAGYDTSDATAVSSDILLSQTAYISTGKTVGTMPNNSAVSSTLNPTQTFTIPQGYHNGSGVISAVGMTETYNVISTNSDGTPQDLGIDNVYRYVTTFAIPNSFRLAHTNNLDDAGNRNGNYNNGDAWTRVLTVPTATNLKVFYRVVSENNCDWGCIWSGEHSTYTAASNYSTSISNRLMGGPATGEYDVTGNTITVAWKSDSSVNDYWGFYVIAMDAALYDLQIIGGAANLTGTAVPSQVLVGNTFYNTDAKTILTGTMPIGSLILSTT